MAQVMMVFAAIVSLPLLANDTLDNIASGTGKPICTEECKGHNAGIFGIVIARVEIDEPNNLEKLIEEIEKNPCADSVVLSFRKTIWTLQEKESALVEKYFRFPSHIPAKTGASVGSVITPSGRELMLLQLHPLEAGHFLLTSYYGCNKKNRS